MTLLRALMGEVDTGPGRSDAQGITVAGMRADQRAYLYNRYRADFEMFGYEA